MARKPFNFKLSPEQQQLAITNINLARREAWRVQRTTGIEYSVLEGAAFLGLCKACNRYDPDSGYKFSSLATPTIRGELLHWVRDKTYAMRLSHRMRENWIRGRRLMVEGKSDIDIAKSLGIELVDWLDCVSACSGPPLELKDQAVPSSPLEPDELDFKEDFRLLADEIIEKFLEREKNALTSYFKGSTSKPPIRLFLTMMNRVHKQGSLLYNEGNEILKDGNIRTNIRQNDKKH